MTTDGEPVSALTSPITRSGAVRVLVVDDHVVVRAGLAQLLETVADIELVGTAVHGNEALTLAAKVKPDVILMDLSMPVMDGVEATRKLVAADPDCHVVVLTSFTDQSRILEALDAGASGYLLKDATPEELFEGIRAAAAGGAPLDPRAARVLLNANRQRRAAPELTDREREVLGLVREGMANKHIARHLGISERTVKAHLTNIFQRIGVADRTQAALWARDNLDT